MKHILCLLVSLYFSLTYAQKRDNNWCFGDSCGINFNDSIGSFFISAASFDTALVTQLENTASISDELGNLLFYTNGSIIWNKNHQQMAHGLHSNTSVTQGSLILPKPDDSSIYYLFHLNPANQSAAVYYALIDMSLANGLGDVIPGKKNVELYAGGYAVSEKLTAIKHANGRDWWIITHASDSNTFNIFLLTPDTVVLISTQEIGTNPFPGYYIFYTGEMILSQSGDKLVLVGDYGIINLFDFDRCSGTFSNFVDLSHIEYESGNGNYGCSFSPDDSKLYASNFDSLFQFDLNDSNIVASKELIWFNPYFLGGGADKYYLGQHQVTPNGKIFISLTLGNPINPPDTFIDKSLCVINNPNEVGLACNFVPDAFYLGGHHAGGGLSNSPNYNLGPLLGSPCDTVYTNIANNRGFKMESLTINPNPAEYSVDYILNFYQPGNHELTIYDLTGKAISTYHLRIPYGHLDVSNFQPGFYLIKLTRNGKMISTSKFIKS